VESFRIDGHSVRSYAIRVDEVTEVSPELVRTLIDIDLQTFAEATFSSYTALALLLTGRVFVLRADEVVIGTCVCYRSWQHPDDATLLAMGIRPGWRGRGLGQRFVSGVLASLQAAGLRTVTLVVGADNARAIRTYSDVGFAVDPHTLADPHSGDLLKVMRCALHDGARVQRRSRWRLRCGRAQKPS
jgi:ribosomal protein S18 acetylase RimI-like enzyme